MTSLTIPNSVTSIGGSAFSGCSGLKELTLEDGEEILSFGSDVFSNAPLESVYLGRSLSDASSASSSLFYNNRTTLTSLTIGNSVTSIGSYAFSGCSGLTSVAIPNSVNIVGDYAFDGCSGLTEVTMEDGESTLSLKSSIFNYCPLESLYLGRTLSCDNSPFKNQTTLTNIIIGNGVASIGDYTFEGCGYLTSIAFPNSVSSIGNSAFSGCSGLTKIAIPNSVTTIGGSAFKDCSGLRLISIPNNVTTIGSYAFDGCSGLRTISIGNSVESIGDYAFNGCSKFAIITIPCSVTSIGNGTFNGCSGLKEVILEDGEETLSLGRNDVNEGLFYDCPLESLYLGRDLSYNASLPYGYSPFYNKGSLNSLIVGSSVTSIGCGLFEDCSGLTEIYSLSSEPAVCDVLPFWGVDKTIPVYIPFGSKSAYKSAAEWKEFKNFIESEFTGVEENEISASDIKVISGNGIEINDYYGKLRIVNLAGQVVKDVYVSGYIQLSLPKGIYIVVTENSSQKVIL